MGIFDNFGKVVTDTYKSATKASGKLIEEGKIKLMIMDNESQMKEIFETIGKEYCECYFRGELLDNSKYENEYEELKRMQLENDQGRERLLHLKKMRKCDNCQREISMDNAFCQFCGNRQSQLEEEEVQAEVENSQETDVKIERKCNKCNVYLEEDATFCPVCGEKIE